MIDEKKVYKGLAANIVKLRDRHPKTEQKITQKVLAESIGIKRATLTNIELGNQRAPVHVVYRICSFFDIALDDLLPNISDIKTQVKSSSVDIGREKHILSEKMSAAVDKARSLN